LLIIGRSFCCFYLPGNFLFEIEVIVSYFTKALSRIIYVFVIFEMIVTLLIYDIKHRQEAYHN